MLNWSKTMPPKPRNLRIGLWRHTTLIRKIGPFASRPSFPVVLREGFAVEFVPLCFRNSKGRQAFNCMPAQGQRVEIKSWQVLPGSELGFSVVGRRISAPSNSSLTNGASPNLSLTSWKSVSRPTKMFPRCQSTSGSAICVQMVM